MQKKRIDILLVEKSLAKSRSQAQQHIQNGLVSVNKKIIKKSSECFYENDEIEIQSTFCWVSRGALKLLHAIEQWNITVENLVCLDIGASTGGFTQVLLENKAKKVYAIDAGHSQMDELLKQDFRVICKEKCNARNMAFEAVGEKVDVIVIDVSFISLTKIMENLLQFAKVGTVFVVLIKPQFEVDQHQLGKNGIVKNENTHKEVCDKIRVFFEILGVSVEKIIPSPIFGGDGNKEFLLFGKIL